MKLDLTYLTRFCCLLIVAGMAMMGGMTSCVSPKTIVYFQGDSSRYSSQEITQKYIPKLQSSDILSIIVGSLNAEANEVFNTPNLFTTSSTNYSNIGGSRLQPLGYLVDMEGDIEIPLIGKMRVSGLTTSQAADSIRIRLQNYLKEPSVIVRNLNFKISVLGEVKLPAVYVIPDEKITLPEVLSLAGDLTIYGNRANVMIIREENGKREYARIDLTSRDIFSSPYYYLHKNDVIYVEPVKARMLDTDSRIRTVPLLVTIVGGISTLGILILNLTN
ncbi:polysaccharide biosynthesis/export family protein [Dyadobacter chenwenxiniae]|uniref:Polysaccharide biosynthesis/export family protein n=1 Tax=Dyadobacter chenwenxiniae TaxID=2906456 RepID=A0A9X1TFK0_9BACT|nr:polysaccharide biosynthesis/export family protein [Dyadobacter chenwenxiniae]MCF0062709.1 polysaccharide biosynthesis/export family protein [Dyadobacter chenwenxiniae]UON83546.1 polysaccharide biosynthesis/export family protein [Dyadobacter chenwenxiniae]